MQGYNERMAGTEEAETETAKLQLLSCSSFSNDE